MTIFFKPKVSDFAKAYVEKHRQDMESGAECKGCKAGDKPNEVFWSNVGSIDATFGKNRNKVDNIGDLEISKRELRCYDVKKDVYGIAWLFNPNAKFHAEKIWGDPKNKQNKIYFKGSWYTGEFKGIMDYGFQQLEMPTYTDDEYLPPTPPPIPPFYYWYDEEGTSHGPIFFIELQNTYHAGIISKNTWVYRKELPQANPNDPRPILLSQLPEFKSI